MIRAFLPELLRLSEALKSARVVHEFSKFPSQDEFKPIAQNRDSFIVRNAFHAPSLAKATQAISSSFPDVSCQIRTGDYSRPESYASNRSYQTLPLAEFLKSLELAKDDDELGYCGNLKIDSSLVEILKLPIPFYSLAEFDKPSLWAGAKGAITPMHMDGLDNFVFQVSGRKRWTLAPLSLYNQLKMSVPFPDIAPNLHLSQIDFRHLSEVSELIKANCQTIEVNEGDFFYLPAGTGHFVETLETGLMVNLWLNKLLRIPAALEAS